jgi:hypothetical protein
VLRSVRTIACFARFFADAILGIVPQLTIYKI